MSPQSVGPITEHTITVVTVKSSSIITGKIGGVLTEMMLDFGSAVSLIHQSTLSQLQGTITKLVVPQLHLVTASGDPLPIMAHLQLPVELHVT